MIPLILVGGGGHCHSCIDVIEQEKKYCIKGIIDNNIKIDTKIMGYSVIGTDDDIPQFIKMYQYALVTVGQIKTSLIRQKLYMLLKNHNATLPTIISPLAYVSPHTHLGEGSIIMHNAIINANCNIGSNCIINTKALCEHDSVIEDHCHIATGTIINGNCTIKQGTFIGSNSVLKQGTTIEQCQIIPYGSTI